MNVEALKNYGKDILSIQEQSNIPFRKKRVVVAAALRLLWDLFKILGPSGTVRFIKGIKEESHRAERLDWSPLKEKGISEKHLQGIIHKMVIAKVTADRIGMEKAALLRRNLSNRISIPVLEETFAPASTFIQCGNGDFLPPFKKYYIALMDAMAKKGLEEAEVIIDERDEFQINVTYCAWAEAAKILGNAQYCYYSTCYGDEVFFPHLCAQAGFNFYRKGTLAQGLPACDMKFTRKKQ